MKIGKPTHLKLNNGSTQCGLVGVEYAAYDPRDVDCLRCMKGKIYKQMMKSETDSNKGIVDDMFEAMGWYRPERLKYLKDNDMLDED